MHRFGPSVARRRTPKRRPTTTPRGRRTGVSVSFVVAAKMLHIYHHGRASIGKKDVWEMRECHSEEMTGTPFALARRPCHPRDNSSRPFTKIKTHSDMVENVVPASHMNS